MNAKLLTFDRSDYRATKVLMILLAICAPAVLLGLPVYDLAAGNPLRVYLPAGALAPISVADGVSVTPWGVVSVEAVGASIGTWVLSLVPPLVVVVALWVALLFLWRVVAAAAAGAPFTRDTVHCLRGIALTVFLGSLAHWLASGIVDAALSRQLIPGEETTLFVSTMGSGGLVAVGAAMLFAMVAEVFARGVVLEDELEGVV
ncbi:MAG: DUF2975 domain-containing protein [Tessaracoccus sp.]|uniref:DUF2975 domain-containing protein n=1 Tax=Tessaracoccus sp. TaxID=1971211 RepID=UPI001EC0A029|nr:DUF2975 domain-containing protein [Tessaracoccus sp.]MBK7822497.1 DUF2975 domain-containing protein [Tessaracoccus sp.]